MTLYTTAIRPLPISSIFFRAWNANGDQIGELGTIRVRWMYTPGFQ